MPECRNCGKSYRGEPPYCDPCEEFKKQERREELPWLTCQACGKTMSPGAFDQHRWRHYYRSGEYPNSRRSRRP